MSDKHEWEAPGHGWRISGPNGMCLVTEYKFIENVIEAMRAGTDFDNDEYTAVRIIDLGFKIDPNSVRRGPVIRD